MNKKLKLTTAILSAGLLVSPVSGVVYQNVNVAKAEYINTNINTITFTDQEFIEATKLAYKKNLISKEVHDIIIAESQNKFSFLGKGVNTIKFYDNGKSYDILLSSGICSTLVGLGAGGAGAAAGAIIALIPGVGAFGAGAVGIIVGAIVGTIISENFDYSKGIVAYYKYGKLQYIYSQ